MSRRKHAVFSCRAAAEKEKDMPDPTGGNLFPEDHEENKSDRQGPSPEQSGGWVTPPPADWGWNELPAQESVYQNTEGYFAPGQPESQEPKPKKRGFFRKVFRDAVIPLAVAFAVAMIFQATVAKPYQIPSGSMKPTINEFDRILADRVVYHFKSIQRGDVVVFNPPLELGSDTPFVKRVIGLPGDAVEIRGGQVLIDKQDGNGPQPFVVSAAMPTSYTMAPETVPDGQLFVLGDNRNESYDSHRWGYVPIDNVIGRAEVIYWPLDHLQFLGN